MFAGVGVSINPLVQVLVYFFNEELPHDEYQIFDAGFQVLTVAMRVILNLVLNFLFLESN